MVAFSAGGDGGRKSPEHQAQSAHVFLRQPAIAVVRCVARRSAG